MLGRPRERAVQGRLVEDDHVAGLAGDVVHDLAVLLPVANFLRQREVGFVAARDHAQPTVPLIDIGELELADDHAAAHLVVGIRVVLRAIEVAAGRAVEDQALGTLAAAEHKGRVVHLPAAAKERVEIGDELFVRQQGAEGQAVGFFPFEHPREHAAPPACERVAAAGIVIAVFAALVLIGVKGRVERIDFGRGEEVGDLQEAL